MILFANKNKLVQSVPTLCRDDMWPFRSAQRRWQDKNHVRIVTTIDCRGEKNEMVCDRSGLLLGTGVLR